MKDGHTLRDQTFEIAVEYFAIFGIDSQVRIFRQSDIHDITKLMWILTNVTPYSLLNRAHSFKVYLEELYKWEDKVADLLYPGVHLSSPHLEPIQLYAKVTQYIRKQNLLESIDSL